MALSLSSLSSLSSPALPSVLGLSVMVLASYVALDIGQRVQRLGRPERQLWLWAATLALSAGLWASSVLDLANLLAHVDASFAALLVGAAAALCFALCLGGLSLMHAEGASRRRIVAGAAVLAGAALAAQLLAVLSLGLAGGMHWNHGLLLLAFATATAGFACCRGTALGRQLACSVARRQLLAAGIMGLTVWASHTLAIEAAGLTVPQPLTPAAAGTLVTLAPIGCAGLLLLMLLGCGVDARLRGRLDEARSALQELALRDELTGLPNRVSFEGTLAQAQGQADASHGQVVLLVVALDGFKHVNESAGHAFGDRVLRRMAQRLRGLVKPHSVARLGSDEFMLLLRGEQAAAQAGALATQVLEAVAQPCIVDGRELGLTCSIGIAWYPQHGAMAALITNASVALRASKTAGGATYSLFDPRMVVDSREQADLLRDLRVALGREQLELYYQPKIHAPSAQITGVEALLRWRHPKRGMISPNIFIPMAERSGLIDAIGNWVVDEACRQSRAWRDQGLRMRVAVNLSAHQLRQPELSQRIAAALAKHQVNPDLLTCEITESVAMGDTEATMRFFKELAAVGVHISIDDFGSGYSSLAYLRKLPANELKIDRSFVLDLETSDEARKIAAAVVQLAQALNLKVVAEGVETNAQFQILRQLGCDELQGFLFARPMSAKALCTWAMAGEGPRTMQFAESLFQGTREMAY